MLAGKATFPLHIRHQMSIVKLILGYRGHLLVSASDQTLPRTGFWEWLHEDDPLPFLLSWIKVGGAHLEVPFLCISPNLMVVAKAGLITINDDINIDVRSLLHVATELISEKNDWLHSLPYFRSRTYCINTSNKLIWIVLNIFSTILIPHLRKWHEDSPKTYWTQSLSSSPSCMDPCSHHDTSFI